MKPFHEHPLLQNYSEWIGADYYFAPWFCTECKAAIDGPPYEIGEYVVTNVPLWRVWMKATFWLPTRTPVFETTRKREALRHARQLEARRRDLERVRQGDQGAIAENFKEVERLKEREKND